MKLGVTVPLVLLIWAVNAAQAATPQWHEVARYPVGGTGGWDLMAVDAAARRVYVTRGDHLMVIDADRGSVVGNIEGLQRAHGIALVAARHHGYITSGGDDSVVVFDLNSLKVIKKITVDHNPDAIVYEPKSERVLAFNGKSNDVSVIDAKTDERVATIALPGKPELAVSDDQGTVFVNLEDVAKVATLDAHGARVKSVWARPECEEPSGIALDPVRRRVFSVCQNQHMVVTDAQDGRHVATVPIGSGPDGAAFDPQSGDVLSSNSDGTLTIVGGAGKDQYRVVQTVTTPERSRCVTFDPKTHRAILAAASFGATPQPTAEEPHPRPPMQPNSFQLLIVGAD
jgi:YVTN family beta-propeller protein